MRREKDGHDFARGNLRQVKAHLVTDSGRVPIQFAMTDAGISRVPIQFAMTDAGIRAYGVAKATNPAIQEAVVRDFDGAVEGGAENFSFRIELKPYSQKRASASWLRSAYLAFSAALGYRFICRPEMRIVRERINNPDQSPSPTFRVSFGNLN